MKLITVPEDVFNITAWTDPMFGAWCKAPTLAAKFIALRESMHTLLPPMHGFDWAVEQMEKGRAVRRFSWDDGARLVQDAGGCKLVASGHAPTVYAIDQPARAAMDWVEVNPE